MHLFSCKLQIPFIVYVDILTAKNSNQLMTMRLIKTVISEDLMLPAECMQLAVLVCAAGLHKI